MSFGTSITELPSLVWNMIRNKVFMIVTLTSCSEFSIVVAFLTFMPKYIQDQFSIDPSKVNFHSQNKNFILRSKIVLYIPISKRITQWISNWLKWSAFSQWWHLLPLCQIRTILYFGNAHHFSHFILVYLYTWGILGARLRLV